MKVNRFNIGDIVALDGVRSRPLTINGINPTSFPFSVIYSLSDDAGVPLCVVGSRLTLIPQVGQFVAYRGGQLHDWQEPFACGKVVEYYEETDEILVEFFDGEVLVGRGLSKDLISLAPIAHITNNHTAL